MSATATALSDIGTTAEARVLLAALHRDRIRLGDSGIEALTPTQWDHLVTIAGGQRVRPLLHLRLYESGRWQHAPAPVWKRLVDECRTIAIRKMRMHAGLSPLLAGLAQRGIPAVVLKGAYLGPVVYKNISLREMNDLDVLVRRAHLHDAIAVAAESGFAALHAVSVERDIRLSQHVTGLLKPGVAGLELHWNVSPPNHATSIDEAQLWDRVIPMDHFAVPCLGLAPEELLLHVCYHASALHQFEFGLRPLCDVAWILEHRQFEIDWDSIGRIAQQRGWARGVVLALQLSRELIGAAVPDHWLRRLAPTHMEAVVPAATRMLWATPSEIGAFSRGLAVATAEESWRGVFATIWRRFIPASAVAPPQGSSPRTLGRSALSLAYDVAGVARRNLWSWWQITRRRDAAMVELAQRRNQIRTWLSGR